MGKWQSGGIHSSARSACNRIARRYTLWATDRSQADQVNEAMATQPVRT
jgi:hypothetical protein